MSRRFSNVIVSLLFSVFIFYLCICYKQYVGDFVSFPSWVNKFLDDNFLVFPGVMNLKDSNDKAVTANPSSSISIRPFDSFKLHTPSKFLGEASLGEKEGSLSKVMFKSDTPTHISSTEESDLLVVSSVIPAVVDDTDEVRSATNVVVDEMSPTSAMYTGSKSVPTSSQYETTTTATVFESSMSHSFTSQSNSTGDETPSVLHGDESVTTAFPTKSPIFSSLNLRFASSDNSSEVFKRRRVNRKFRTAYTDVLKNIGSDRHVALPGEFKFRQYHTIRYYEGSHPDIVARNRSELPVTDKFDISVISQTTKERLFFFPYLLKRWPGPISIAVMVKLKELDSVISFIEEGDFPDRLRLALYIYNYPDHRDCVYRKAGRSVRCMRNAVYPINRLRNIAIRNTLTSHFVVFDMDMWPANFTYETLLNLPKSYLENPYFVTIVPAFSLSNKLISKSKCNNLRSCVSAAIKKYPETKEDLVKCMNTGGCTIFRPASLTHNYLPKKWKSLPPSKKVVYMPCFKQLFMEPYVMVKRTSALPYFDERFINYGFNKVQWIENMRYLGFEFYVLAQAYAVDIPHSLSDFAKEYSQRFKERHVDMLALYRRFLCEMRKEHKDASRQLLCLPGDTDITRYRFL